MFTGAFTPAFKPLFRSNEAEYTYIDKVKDTFGASLIAYWPLNEASGTTAVDAGANGYNGAYTGVDLGQTGIGDGETAPYFDGANDFVNVYSAGLAGAFNGAAGTAMVWGNSVVGNDGLNKLLVYFPASFNNRIDIRKTTTGSIQMYYTAGGVSKTANVGALTPGSYAQYALTWDKAADQAILYLNGAQSGATLTGLGTWSGALSSSATVIGSNNLTPNLPWYGNLAHCALGNTALTPTQIAALAVLP